MDNDILSEFEEDFGLFVEAGFLAAKQLDERASRRLFEAAGMLKEDSPAPIVGMGFIELNKLEIKVAIEYFKQALKMEPEHHLAQAFLGICYLLIETRREEGEKLLADAIKKSDDPTIGDLAEVALEWADKDLKKKKAPFFAAEKKNKK